LEEKAKKHRAFVNEILYPFVLENSKSISDAVMMLKVSSIALQSMFTKRMQKEQKRLSDLTIKEFELKAEVLNPKDHKRDIELMQLFNDMTLSEANSLLDGLAVIIEGTLKEEGIDRKLETLKIKLLK